MLKKLIGILAVIVIALTSVGLFVACDHDEDANEPTSEAPAEAPQEKEPEVHDSEDGFFDF